MPTTFGTRDDAKDPGPWPHKILEIGMVTPNPVPLDTKPCTLNPKL